MDKILKVIEICKKYKNAKVFANDHISFTIESGEILGLLGPNGAGKTTLVRQVSGNLLPTSGSILINNKNILTEKTIITSTISSMPQHVFGQRFLSCYEFVTRTGMLRGLSSKTAALQANWLLDIFSFQDQRKKLIWAMSGGEQRLTSFIATIIGFRRHIILDEPTNDLDPANRKTLWDLLKYLKEKLGLSILLVTHNTYEAEAAVDRVVIISEGKVLTEGSIAQLIDNSNLQTGFELKFTDDHIPSAEVLGLQNLEKLDRNRFFYSCARQEGADLLQRISAIDKKAIIEEFYYKKPSLSDIYLEAVKAGNNANN